MVLVIALAQFSAMGQSTAQGDHVNYCKLVEVGEYYGQLSLASERPLTQDQIKYFNGSLELVYLNAKYRLEIGPDEFSGDGLFSFEKTKSFPPSGNYDPGHTDTYTIFHAAKELYRLQHFDPSCNDCSKNSLDTLNQLIMGKPVWSDYNKQWRNGPKLNRPLVQAEVLDFDTFLKCYFIPDFVLPTTLRLSFPGPRLICNFDTVKVKCRDDIKAKKPGVIPNCNMGANIKELPRSLVRGVDNCPNALYVVAHVAFSPCGKDTCRQYFIIENDEPEITCPPDRTVECADQIVAEKATYKSSCKNKGTVNSDQYTLASGIENCPGAKYEIKYFFTDTCGRIAECVQTFTIANDPPTVVCAQDSIVECFQDIPISYPKVTTSCQLKYTWEVVGPRLVSGRENCPNAIYQVDYTVTDECGRKASCSRRYTIDNPPPIVNCPDDRTVECLRDITIDTPLVITSCGQSFHITQIGPTLISGIDDCDGAEYRIEYIVIEECGRTVKCEQIFTIANQGPTAECWEDEIVVCEEDIVPKPPVVTTSCDVTFQQDESEPENLGGIDDCPGTVYEVRYTITDACDREVECTQLFIIANPDPKITCPPDREVVSVDQITPENPEIEVACDLDHQVEAQMPPQLVSGEPDCPGAVYELTYVLIDTCGRKASCTQRFTIMDRDIIIDCPPDLVVKCEDEIKIHSTSSWLFGVVKINSTSGPEIIQGRPNCPGAIYEIVYYLDPPCDSTVTCIQHIVIENDGPEITCPQDVTITDIDEQFDQTTTVKTSCGLDSYVTTGPLELMSGAHGQPPSTYRMKYTVEDDCGREADCYQNVTLIGFDDVPTNKNPCNCDDQWWDPSIDLTESRVDKFSQDIAVILKKKSCKEIQSLVESGATALFNEWASREILGTGYGYGTELAKRGNIGIALSHIGDIKTGIQILEAALYGSEKEMRDILTTEFLTRAATYISGSGSPALVITAIKDLGKFTAYLNREILISNLKTFADHAASDPDFFNVNHFLNTYAGLEELKVPGRDIHNKYRLAIYDYAQYRMNGYALPYATEVWNSQENLNAIRVATRTMLNEVCEYYCYKKRLKIQVDRLKVEQSYLERFQKVWEYFKDTDCSGGLNQPPACNIAHATLVEISPGKFECNCDPGYKFSPDRSECVTYDDCSAIPNTSEVFQNGKYECDCIGAGYEWNPTHTACVVTPTCDLSANEELVWDPSTDSYICRCVVGYKKDPTGTFCVPYENCTTMANSVEVFNVDRYECECDAGFKLDPSGVNCVPYTDCSGTPHSVEIFRVDRYECVCEAGYKPDPSFAKCVPYEDCSTIANTHEVFQGTHYICDCLPGYSWNSTHTACLGETDCSIYPNSSPVWNDALEVYECDCIAGYEWNSSYTACIEKPPDCPSFYANTVAVWNPSTNRYECDCISGYEWNSTNTGCIKSMPDCQAYYANTVAVWNSATAAYECDCMQGYEWNASKTGCVPIPQTPICNMPNTQLYYDNFYNEYYCDCVPGYKWNRSKTGCIQKVDPTQTIDALTGLIGVIAGGVAGGTGNRDNPTVSPAQQHTGQCNVSYGSGADEPEQYTIDVYQTTGSLTFTYNTITIKDRIHVYYGGVKIFDTGCVGDSGSQTFTLNGYSSVFRIIVDPLCDPNESDTAWSFTLGCP